LTLDVKKRVLQTEELELLARHDELCVDGSIEVSSE